MALDIYQLCFQLVFHAIPELHLQVGMICLLQEEPYGVERILLSLEQYFQPCTFVLVGRLAHVLPEKAEAKQGPISIAD